MSRYIVLIAFYSLFSLASAAQEPGDKPAGAAQNNASQRSNAASRSQPTADARVSIARLRVPGKARELYEKAVEAWQKQETAEAQRKVVAALKIDPAFPEALTLHGFIQASLHQWESAEASLQAAIRSDPSYSSAYVILAGIYNTQERYDEADMAARQAVSAGANTWSVQYEIARVLIGKGEYESALAVLDEAMRAKHGNLLLVAKAHALLGLRRYREAATELESYLRDEPSGEGSQDARDILERLRTIASR